MGGTLSLGINSGLLSAGVVAAFLISMGVVVFVSDTKSITNRWFFFLTTSSVIWSLFNYGIYRTSDPVVMLWLLRLIMFSAVWFAYSFFTLFYAFPNREQTFPAWYKFLLLPATASISIVTLTPLVFEQLANIPVGGQAVQVINGPGIFLFGILVFTLDFGAVSLIIRKLLKTRDAMRKSYRIILIGTITTIVLIMVFSFMLPAFFGNSAFVAYGTLALIPFIGCTAYAINRNNVLNVKEIGTAFLVSALASSTLVELIFTTDPVLILFRTSLFVLILLVGLLLIRSVVHEVQQREKIQKLAEQLQETNDRQEGLIHFIGHEVKGTLTKDEGTLSELIDGDFGVLPDTAKAFVERALAESRHGVEAVANILRASNLKKGTVTYTKELFDLKASIAEAVEKTRVAAEQKGLGISFTAEDSTYQMMGDKEQISEHVFRNLIDNAVNYTPSGSIAVSLKRQGNRLVFSVRDTGVGITDEDKQKLFTEGGHGADSQRVNAHSTGYGLFIAKQVTEANGGTIRAESLGAGQGSTFVVEFPA